MASKALLNARETGEGPVFNDDQNANLAAICKQKGVDPAEFLAAYTTHIRSMLPPKATGPKLVAFFDKALKECPEPAEIIGLYRKKSGRQPSGELPADKLERLYQDLHSEREKARVASQYNEQQLKIHEDCLNMAWHLYTTLLRVTVQKLHWSPEVRKVAWEKGHALMTGSTYDYADRKKETRAEKLCKKAAEAKTGVNELIDLAGQIDVTGDPRDIEDLIGEHKKQAAALDSIADKTAEMDLIEEMAVLKAKLKVSSKKLRKQRDEMLDQGMSKPSFSRSASEAMPILGSKLGSSHWYADLSPGGGWADKVEEEEKSHGRQYQPEGRPRWDPHLELEEDEPFIRGCLPGPVPASPGQAGQPDVPACETSSPCLACLHR